MKQKIIDLILAAATSAYENGELHSSEFPDIEVEVPKVKSHGDFSTNISMVMASVQKMPPRKIAEAIIQARDIDLEAARHIEKALAKGGN